MTWKPNATVAVIVPQGETYLMVEEESEGAVVINQPAGHIEENESIFDAARRETLEETGYEVELTGFLGLYIFRSPFNGLTYHRNTFVARALGRVSDELDDGIIAPHWMTREQLEQAQDQLRSPLVLQCIKDYERGGSLPLETVREL